MKRILCLIGQLRGGGTERQLYLFLKHLNKTKYEPGVVVSGDPEGKWYKPIIDCGIPVYSLGRIGFLRKSLKLRTIISEYQPALVFSWSFFTNAYKYLCPDIAFIGSLRGDLNSARRNPGKFLWNLCLSPSNFVVNSEHLKKQLIVCGISEHKIHLIENIFDPDTILKDNEDRERIRKRYNIPENAKVIIGSGRNTYEKNLNLFIEVFVELKTKSDGWYAFLIGNCAESLRPRIEELGLQEKLFLPGEVENPFEFYRASDVFFLSSRTEGMPNVVLEALHCGCKIVAMDVGGINDIKADNPLAQIKILKQNENKSKIAEEILLLLNTQKNDSCKFDIKFYSPENIMKKYTKLLDSCKR